VYQKIARLSLRLQLQADLGAGTYSPSALQLARGLPSASIATLLIA